MNAKVTKLLTKRLDKPKCSRCAKRLNADWDDLGLTPFCRRCRDRLQRELQRAHPRAERRVLDVAVALLEGIDEAWLIDSMVEQGATLAQARRYLAQAKPIARVGNRWQGTAAMIGGGAAFAVGLAVLLVSRHTNFTLIPYGVIGFGALSFLFGLAKAVTGLRLDFE